MFSYYFFPQTFMPTMYEGDKPTRRAILRGKVPSGVMPKKRMVDKEKFINQETPRFLTAVKNLRSYGLSKRDLLRLVDSVF